MVRRMPNILSILNIGLDVLIEHARFTIIQK